MKRDLKVLANYLEKRGFLNEASEVTKLAVMGPTDQQIKQYQSRQKAPAKDYTPAAHFLLDLLGLVPVYGEAADFANAALYLSKGLTSENILMAGLSLVSMVPAAGDVAKFLKYGYKLAPEVLKKMATIVWQNRGAIQALFSKLKSVQAVGQLSKIPNGKLIAENADRFWPIIQDWIQKILNYEIKRPVGEAVQSKE